MGAPGQDAPAPDTGAQPGGEAQQQNSGDPWETAYQAIPEATRKFAEEAFNPLREQFTPRLELADRLEPLGNYADDLLALASDADDDGNSLEDILGFTSMLSQVDPENPESEGTKAFAQWWENIGEQLGLFADDGDDGEDPDDGADTGDEFEQRFARLEQENQALREQLNGVQTDTRVQSVQKQITDALDGGLKQHGIEDTEENRNYILRLSRSYAEDVDLSNQQMIEKGLADYLTLTGQGQRELLNGQEVERIPAGRSPNGGSPDTSPEDLLTGDPAVSRKRASQLARQRLANAS